MPVVLAGATRGLFLQSALAETISQFLHDFIQRHIAGPQDDKQMVENVRRFSRQMPRIILHRCKNEFDGFFTKFASALLAPCRQQLGSIGNIAIAGSRALGNDGLQFRQNVRAACIGHARYPGVRQSGQPDGHPLLCHEMLGFGNGMGAEMENRRRQDGTGMSLLYAIDEMLQVSNTT